MANFGKISLTNTGVNALVKVQAGSPLVFTKIKMGSGLYTGDIKVLTDLTESKLSAEIVKGTALENTYRVEAHFTNEGLAEGFYWREIGLYIKDSSGNDALFGYANSGTTADYIPATTSEIYSKHVRISVAVADSANVTVEHTSGTYVDVVTFEESMAGKVDKVEGKGLSTNDYSDEEQARITALESSLQSFQTSVDSSLSNIKKTIEGLVTSEDLDTVVSDINSNLEDLSSAFDTSIKEISDELTGVKNSLGKNNITSLGDGTVTGAILALYELINGIPAITSGTSEPSGGSDGDVYIMYED